MRSKFRLGETRGKRWVNRERDLSWCEYIEGEVVAQRTFDLGMGTHATIIQTLVAVPGGFRVHFMNKSPRDNRYHFAGCEFPQKDGEDRFGDLLMVEQVREIVPELYEQALLNGILDRIGEEQGLFSKERVLLRV